MAEEVILLNSLASPFGMRVSIALAEKGIKHEFRLEDLRNKSPLLLEMNPVHKMVPVLIHNGKPIVESHVIVQYIDEVWPGNGPLLPSHPYHRSQARFWADFVDKKIHGTGKNIMALEGEERAQAGQEMINALKMLEGELGDKAYFGGQSIGYVDVALLPFYQWFYTYEKLGIFNVEVSCPKLSEWGQRCLHKEHISKSIPPREKLYSYFLDFNKES